MEVKSYGNKRVNNQLLMTATPPKLRCTFCIMGQQLNFKLIKKSVVKIKPETEWSNYEQVEEIWRTEPTSVAKAGDDLWLGVKG
jgi:hypothetical protein